MSRHWSATWMTHSRISSCALTGFHSCHDNLTVQAADAHDGSHIFNDDVTVVGALITLCRSLVRTAIRLWQEHIMSCSHRCLPSRGSSFLHQLLTVSTNGPYFMGWALTICAARAPGPLHEITCRLILNKYCSAARGVWLQRAVNAWWVYDNKWCVCAVMSVNSSPPPAAPESDGSRPSSGSSRTESQTGKKRHGTTDYHTRRSAGASCFQHAGTVQRRPWVTHCMCFCSSLSHKLLPSLLHRTEKYQNINLHHHSVRLLLTSGSDIITLFNANSL